MTVGGSSAYRVGLLRTVIAFACALAVGCGGGDKHGKDHGGTDAGKSGAGGGGTDASSTSGGSAGAGGTGAAGGTSTGGAGTGGVVTTTGGTSGSGGQDASSTGGVATINLDGGFDASAPIASLKKVDLLLVVDNSLSMADKAELLSAAVPDLIAELVDPLSGIEDLHVGVITSSLGSFGTTVCDDTVEQENDHAHLVGTLPRASSLGLADGFVRWDPTIDPSVVTSQVEDLITLAGDQGCGWEFTLEAMYRFVADPNPPAGLVFEPCSATNSNPCASYSGTDEELLAQRQAFFRPDSLVAVVVLSDENDCSMRPDGQNYYTARSDIRMPRATSICATNPNDPCCTSCGAVPPSGCDADPACTTLGSSLTYTEDRLNLRCFEQKRRFGFDTLYPTRRYINALTQPTLCTTRVDLDTTDCPTVGDAGTSGIVDNPLFAGAADAGIVRQASMVQYLGIVGVPWQNVAATVDVNGQPLPADALRFMTAEQVTNAGLWPVILGDSTASPPVPPAEPLMQESVTPRTGVTTTTAEALQPPTAGYMANSINGHEWNSNDEDLQYACIFQLATSRDCSLVPSGTGCDCETASFDQSNTPLCQEPGGTYGSIQYAAKAYPSLRHLDVMRGLGPNAIVASICTRNVQDTEAADFGFRPAIVTALEQWKARLSAP